MTVGKTHCGKTTFAHILENKLSNAVVVDQDNHALFLNKHYKKLQPKHGPNTLKHALSLTIVNHAMEHTDFHLIISNSNSSRQGRMDLLNYFHKNGFSSILVNFNISDDVLVERINQTTRSTSIFRKATSFQEVLKRQQNDSLKNDITAPGKEEADYLFTIQDDKDVASVTDKIVQII